jgi:SPP1 family predicted phage head-tail adaptor
MNIAAGRLNRKIVIKTQGYTQSASGAATATYATLATVWANVSITASSEPVVNRGKTNRTDVTFIIRYRSDVSKSNKITYDSVDYFLTSVVPDGRKEYLTITAESES